MHKNYSIKCDVTKCRHNAEGCNCCLNSVKITRGCEDNKTCCDDYSEE